LSLFWTPKKICFSYFNLFRNRGRSTHSTTFEWVVWELVRTELGKDCWTILLCPTVSHCRTDWTPCWSRWKEVRI
jgi:hypothetical protein